MVEVLVERQIIMPSFAELERADAGIAMRRIQYSFDRALDRIALSARDWGNWRDVWRFMRSHDPGAVNEDMPNSALREIGANLVLIVDRDGDVVFSRAIDLASGHDLDLELAARHSLPEDFPWRARLTSGEPATGLLRTERGTLMLAAGPVLDGDGHGPSRGLVMVGRLLNSSGVADIARQAQAKLSLLAAPASRAPDRLTQSDAVTHVDRDFVDIYGKPLLTLRVDVPRDITARGRTAVTYAFACRIAAAVVVLILMLLGLDGVILHPLARVTRHALAVGKDQDLTTRLALERQDEIGVLAREFDRMVERVADSRTRLVDQSFEAGFAELAKGVLHNLGNAMTPIGVRLANLAERLETAPIEDAEHAARELKGDAAADTQRRADLEEFLLLACQEVAATVRAAQEDVAVMTRQTAVIRGALAEQMRSTRKEHVIEPVRLNELVTQSLEIVPDACRQRLAVQSDDSLRRIGVVHVARTMLRLVLQNLIINAAEAVRDAGKDQGVLRVSAEIVAADGRQHLHLHCQDDGVGIAADNLERVFEKGFSTKSRETNQGIGLHWCANVIGALGGRIWAASDGPGQGASVHLRVPLVSREAEALAGAAA
ncbi:MAG: HAMP domain-containing protein [Gammaproteobacteria bacterium]|nr:HAMP domain-containing protein [Gammaproteobacteria bacterium]